MVYKLKSRRTLGPVQIVLLSLALFALPAAAERTDVVVLINGNAVTGEVKSLDFGSLRYKTDSMGTVDINWEDIVSLTSKQRLQIELTDGTRYFGEIMPTGDRHFVRIVTRADEYEVRSDQIVRITPIETSDHFLKRLDGSFTFGIQTQKSSDITTSNLAADVSYRARKYLVGMRVNSSLTDQKDEPTTARQSANFNYQRFRNNRWFTEWFTGWEKNDEQGIASRVSAGGAFGRYLVQTNKNQFSATIGIQGANTEYSAHEEVTTDAEGRIEIRYLRRSVIPESSIIFTTTIYPLLEDLSQYRSETDLSLRRELVDDLFFELSVGYSFLSDPPPGGATTDYTAATSIGYSF